MEVRKARQVEAGRVRVFAPGRVGRFVATDKGENGDVVDGVDKEFRWVDIVSSRVERERRRNARERRQLVRILKFRSQK